MWLAPLLLASAPATSGSGAVPQAVPAEAEAAPGAVRARVEGPLDVGTGSLLARAIRAARDAGGPLIVELDTPGGEVELMWKLARQIDSAARDDGVRTVAWVHDRALSAGVFLALACERIYVRPEGTLGAAAPVTLLPGAGAGALPDPLMQEKVTSAVRASFRAMAESRGRPPALAEAMVDADVGVREVRLDGEWVLMTQSEYDDARMRGAQIEEVRTVVEVGHLASVTGAEAVRLGLADGLASDQGELLEKLGARGAAVVSIERERSEDLAALLHALRWALLLGGIACGYLELKTPGFGAAGALALCFFGLFLFGQYLVGLADVPHLVAVVLGLLLLAAEVFLVPGTIWLGLAGGVLLLAGIALAIGGVGSDLEYPLDRAILFDAVFQLALWSTAAWGGAFLLFRHVERLPLLRRLVLGTGSAGGSSSGAARALAAPPVPIGALGRAVTDLRPVGKVLLDEPGSAGGRRGGDVEALAEGAALDRGARVRVVGASGGRLLVEAVE
jgi:membrane-bound serine protease (ClpP class)